MSELRIESTETRETFIFDDAGLTEDGRVAWLGYEMSPAARVPEHFHPGHGQYFQVVSGTLAIACAQGTLRLKAGERYSVPPGGWHSQWNEGPERVVLIEGYEPPLAIKPFFSRFATVFPAVMKNGKPKSFRDLLRLAIFVDDFVTVSRPRSRVQYLALAILARIGRATGLATWYERISSTTS